jgi:hypothetical protein
MGKPAESIQRFPACHSVVIALRLVPRVDFSLQGSSSSKSSRSESPGIGCWARLSILGRSFSIPSGILAALLSGVAYPLVGMVWAVHGILLSLKPLSCGVTGLR